MTSSAHCCPCRAPAVQRGPSTRTRTARSQRLRLDRLQQGAPSRPARPAARGSAWTATAALMPRTTSRTCPCPSWSRAATSTCPSRCARAAAAGADGQRRRALCRGRMHACPQHGTSCWGWASACHQPWALHKPVDDDFPDSSYGRSCSRWYLTEDAISPQMWGCRAWLCLIPV